MAIFCQFPVREQQLSCSGTKYDLKDLFSEINRAVGDNNCRHSGFSNFICDADLLDDLVSYHSDNCGFVVTAFLFIGAA